MVTLVLTELGSAFIPKDETQSSLIAKENQRYIKKNRCYDNVYHLVIESSIIQSYPALLIAYGAIEAQFDELFLRHCFFYDSEKKCVIDPTIPAREKRAINPRYLIAEAFPWDTYIDIVVEGRTPDFWDNRRLRKSLQAMEQWAQKNGIVIAG